MWNFGIIQEDLDYVQTCQIWDCADVFFPAFTTVHMCIGKPHVACKELGSCVEVFHHPAAPEREVLDWTLGQLQGSDGMDAQEHVVFNFLASFFQVLAFIGQRWVLSGGQPCLPFESQPSPGV